MVHLDDVAVAAWMILDNDKWIYVAVDGVGAFFGAARISPTDLAYGPDPAQGLVYFSSCVSLE